MPAHFCLKPKGSCPTCPHYRPDPDKNGQKSCFANKDLKGKTTNYYQ